MGKNLVAKLVALLIASTACLRSLSLSVLTLNNGIASRRQSLCIIHLAPSLLYIPSCSLFSLPFLSFSVTFFSFFDLCSFVFLLPLVFSQEFLFFCICRSSREGIHRQSKDRLKRCYQRLTPRRLCLSTLESSPRIFSNFTDISSRFAWNTRDR